MELGVSRPSITQLVGWIVGGTRVGYPRILSSCSAHQSATLSET
jgi:hypothetical protein